MTPENWVRSRNDDEEDPDTFFRKNRGGGGAVFCWWFESTDSFDVQPDSGVNHTGKDGKIQVESKPWTMIFLNSNFLLLFASCSWRVWGLNYSVITAWKHVFAVFVYLKLIWWRAEVALQNLRRELPLKEAETAPVQGGKGGISLRITNALGNLRHLFERTSGVFGCLK